MEKEKVLVLLSGGLDSRLAVKILQEQQNLNVEALFFILPFGGGCCSDKFCVFRFAQEQKIKLNIIDLTKGKLFQEYVEMLRHPKFSRGTAMNPCIDCHIFMLKKAKEYADKNGITIIATGEVLNERPLSQKKPALEIVERESRLKGILLRPLSALLLQETEAEKSGIINRKNLFSINGRNRQKQIELAEKYKISYPTPGGGCLLCEKGYCEKLKQILKNKNLAYKDIELLKIGRHFLSSKIILGRNEIENTILEKEQGIKIIPKEPGPTALIRNENKEKEKLIKQAKELIQKYSKREISGFVIKKTL
ncbi:tRNA 4-thiouridine(8) synthase ThiI [Candidatus Pacearchaeota archaeon]|nr:tRNA 4-thiouridine(8) synthase ThiI [Candidatus Pacearchaeota archaeon]